MSLKQGKSDKGTKLHSVTRSIRQDSAMLKLQMVEKNFASVAGGDYWAERGEAGRWVGVHTTPRTFSFLPWKLPADRGRKTRLTHERSTRGVNSQGRKLRVDNSWDNPASSSVPMRPWTDRTIFMVDNVHIDRWGTDQQRQRIEVGNLKGSRELSWFRLSENTNPQ